jgi:hypothetical protein
MWRCECTDPMFLVISLKWRWVVASRARLSYPPGMEPLVPIGYETGWATEFFTQPWHEFWPLQTMKNNIFWNLSSCSLVKVFLAFRRNILPLFSGRKRQRYKFTLRQWNRGQNGCLVLTAQHTTRCHTFVTATLLLETAERTRNLTRRCNYSWTVTARDKCWSRATALIILWIL